MSSQTSATATKSSTPAPLILRRKMQRGTGVLLVVALILFLSLVSLAVGSSRIPLPVTLNAIFHFDPTISAHLLIRELRVPRTFLALLVGAALGLAGTIMQAITRNPLAEPGLLGINAGAAAAVTIGVSFFGIISVTGYVWFGFIGAGLASLLVYILGRAADAGTNPIRLILAGAALSVVLGAFTNILLINASPNVLSQFLHWATGSLQGRGYNVLPVIAIVCAVVFVLAFALAKSLDAMALGGDMSQALGLNTRTTMIVASAAVLLLAGAATAAAGPIGFIGLAAPHAARLLVGPGHRWLLPYAMLISACMLLMADIVARVVLYPGEVGVGIMTAIIGGPVFLMLVRRKRIARL